MSAFVSLPADFMRRLINVVSGTQAREIPVLASFRKFLALYPTLDNAGDVERTAVQGSNLYYQPIPSTDDTLTIHYYRKPVDMADSSDTPDGIPEHLQEDILVPYAAYLMVSDDSEKGDDLRQYLKQQYIEGLMALREFLGPEDRRPDYFNDRSDYIDQYGDDSGYGREDFNF